MPDAEINRSREISWHQLSQSQRLGFSLVFLIFGIRAYTLVHPDIVNLYIMTTFRPRIAITLGDPAGVGPELAAKLLANPQNRARADLLVLADRCEVEAAASVANVTIPISEVAGPESVKVLDDGTAPTISIGRGKVSKEAGERTFHQLKRAVAMVNRDEADAIVFTPLNKTSLHMAGMHEEDELRWFAKHLNHDGTTSEVNIIPGLWTARVTSHVAIKDVSSRISKSTVFDAVELLNNLL